MNVRLLNLLCCPTCREALSLTVLAGQVDVEEGVLTCGGCGRTYPVINAIPRLLPDELAQLVTACHPDFFTRHAQAMRSYVTRCRKCPNGWWWRAEQRTVRSYSYQWRKFKEMFPHWEQVFQDSIRPIEPSFFAGKLGLDAGCGYGRSLRYAASYGAETIGLDLSEAIEAARENTRDLANVHLVQGDIFHLPVRAMSLDFVYSIGVLQHLPDPKRGFVALSRLLKADAPLFVWVYARGRGRQIAVFTAMRAIATRLPLRLLDVLCLILATGQWMCWIAPHRLLHRFRVTRGFAERLPFRLYAQYPFRVLHADWFDGLSVALVNYYKPEEIADWYRDAGLGRVQIDREWGGRAIGYAPAVCDTRESR